MACFEVGLRLFYAVWTFTWCPKMVIVLHLPLYSGVVELITMLSFSMFDLMFLELLLGISFSVSKIFFGGP